MRGISRAPYVTPISYVSIREMFEEQSWLSEIQPENDTPIAGVTAGITDLPSNIDDVSEALRAMSADNSGVLPERDQRILEFERQWWKFAGAKEQAIREQFDMSATRYYQVLNSLIDLPEALAFDPMLVKRLQRMRAARQRARSARRLGIELNK